MMRFLMVLLAVAGLAISVCHADPAAARVLPAIAPAVSCQSLRGFDPRIAGYPVEIDSSAEKNGECRVAGTVSPQIRFEVRLPLKGWTQRYLQTGCGGLCGNLDIRAPQRACPALVRGEFATASSDMGHEGQGGKFGATDQQLRVDFAYRGMHATALVAKALIRQFYGQGPRYSYFSGCSDGGREALMEAQRFPSDFDGIAAGAPAMNFQVQNTFHHAWMALSSDPGLKGPVLTAADMPVLHAAALAACDRLDGLADGLISDPLRCRFDPMSAVCRSGQSTNCLTPAAAEAAQRLYSGAMDGQGHRFEVGGLMPGSELGWPGVGVVPDPNVPSRFPPPPGPPVPGSVMFASDTIQYLAFPGPLGPDWKLTDFRFDMPTFDALRTMHALYDATDPDLSRFAAGGGKLLVWHGLSDQHISPANTVAYAQVVDDKMGSARAAAFMRTFLIPGMYHCGSGDGLTSIDVLTPLMAWVEDGDAPSGIVASRSDAEAETGKGRTVYAWPARSALKRGADPELPASWVSAEPASPLPKLYAGWYGGDFYRPGYERDCRFDGLQFVCSPAS